MPASSHAAILPAAALPSSRLGSHQPTTTPTTTTNHGARRRCSMPRGWSRWHWRRATRTPPPLPAPPPRARPPAPQRTRLPGCRAALCGLPMLRCDEGWGGCCLQEQGRPAVGETAVIPLAPRPAAAAAEEAAGRRRLAWQRDSGGYDRWHPEGAAREELGGGEVSSDARTHLFAGLGAAARATSCSQSLCCKCGRSLR